MNVAIEKLLDSLQDMKMDKKNFAVCVTITFPKPNPQRISAYTILDIIEAYSLQEAKGITYEWALEKYPIEEGYSSHFVLGMECPKCNFKKI
jgi:hypothetical protein